MKKHQHIFLYIMIMVILSGCSGTFGKIQTNHSLSISYSDSLQVKKFNYYYCGRPSLPYAVVGIDKKYKFNDRVWYKINTPDNILSKIDHLIDTPDSSYKMIVADILDSRGNKIGIWFSYYTHTVIKISMDNKVVDVYNPYAPNDDRYSIGQ
jgi:hypothetical protein